MLTVGSLFSGIGGLDLGLERAGMQVRWQVEIDPYCQRVLEKHWPSVKRYGDIKQVKWNEVEPVDLICGGFPCQPVSVAGARKGDSDERWLWPEFLGAIREVRPRYALVENVPGLLSTDDGRLARGVFGDLAEIGYDAEWDIVSAADVGAPHLRKRVFIIAYPQSDLWHSSGNEGFVAFDWSHSSLEDSRQSSGNEGAEVKAGVYGLIEEWDSRGQSSGSSEARAMANPDEKGLEGWYQQECRSGESEEASRRRSNVMGDTESIRFIGMGKAEDEWQVNGEIDSFDDPSESIRGRGQWAVEPDVGRVANGVPSRMDRLKCLGNAVVPQVAEYIGRLIVEAETKTRREQGKLGRE